MTIQQDNINKTPVPPARVYSQHLGNVFAVLLTFCVLLPSVVQANDANTNSEQTLFSFDDHSIPWKNNLKLTMVPAEKHANNPLVRRGPKGSCDEWAVQFYGSVIQHEGKFKAWYIAADDESLELIKRGKGFSGLRPAYAESKDGINWHKPNLGLVEHNGSKQNNLVRMDPPDAAGIHLIVIHEEDEPNPSRRFKMLLTVAAHLGKTKGSSSITLFSADGLNWKSATPVKFDNGFLLEKDMILPITNFEQGGLFRWRGMYHLPGQQFSPSVWQPDGKPVGRVMTTLRSPDLVHWEQESALGFIRGTEIGKVGSVSHDEEAHLASSVWNRGNVLLGVYGLWHGSKNWQDRSIDLGLMVSNDGLHFREPIRDYVLIPRGIDGEWDQGGLLQGQGFINSDDKTFIYYGSWDLTKPSYPPRGGIGMVSFRRDGFGYLSKYEKEDAASLVTSLIHPSHKASKIVANVDHASVQSPLKVELLDSKSRPIPNHSGNMAGRIKTSGTRQEVVWPATGSSAINHQGPYSVRVTFPANGDARVYAIYVGE